MMWDFDPYLIILQIPVFLLSLSVHEFAHAKVADMLGDPTPRWSGRLTLDPRAHIDPFGLLALFIMRLGWAKPVPINPSNFKNYRRGTLWVGLAGPISNLILGFLTALIIHAWRWVDPLLFVKANNYLLTSYSKIFFDFLSIMLIINVSLAVFNMLPIPPLDGSRVLAGLLPPRQARFLDYLEGNLGSLILLFLVFTRALGGIIGPIRNAIIGLMGL